MELLKKYLLELLSEQIRGKKPHTGWSSYSHMIGLSFCLLTCFPLSQQSKKPASTGSWLLLKAKASENLTSLSFHKILSFKDDSSHVSLQPSEDIKSPKCPQFLLRTPVHCVLLPNNWKSLQFCQYRYPQSHNPHGQRGTKAGVSFQEFFVVLDEIMYSHCGNEEACLVACSQATSG